MKPVSCLSAQIGYASLVYLIIGPSLVSRSLGQDDFEKFGLVSNDNCNKYCPSFKGIENRFDKSCSKYHRLELRECVQASLYCPCEEVAVAPTSSDNLSSHSSSSNKSKDKETLGTFLFVVFSVSMTSLFCSAYCKRSNSGYSLWDRLTGLIEFETINNRNTARNTHNSALNNNTEDSRTESHQPSRRPFFVIDMAVEHQQVPNRGDDLPPEYLPPPPYNECVKNNAADSNGIIPRY